MLTLRRLTLREVRLPLVERFEISSGAVRDRRILLLEAEEASGAVGWGECVAGETPYFGPETLDTAWLALGRWLAPALLGRELEGPAAVSPLLERAARGHNMARGALEMTCWDLAAVLAGEPLAKLLGGTRERVETGISIGLQKDPETLVEKARQALERGYRKIKMKIKPGADVAYVAAVRRALGPEAPLAVDANAAYTWEDLPVLRRLAALNPMMIEQPLHWDDLSQHARLQRRLEVPICLDESVPSPQRARDMLALGAGRVLNIKPGRVGGFAPSLAIHELCRAHREDGGEALPVWCGGMLESGIGRAHNVALASLSGFTLPGDLSPSARYWERDVVTPEWTMDEHGRVTVPWHRPGRGVEVDRERVEALTARCETIAG